MEKITIIGCGPGSPEYMTRAGLDAAAEADFLVGGAGLLSLIPDSAAEKINIGADVQKALAILEDKREKGKTVLLVSGDPGLFSLAKPVINKFGRHACRVIPGISSVQAAFARVGIGWDGAMIISAHAADPDVDMDQARKSGKIAILGGRGESLKWARDFADAIGGDRSVFICENIGRENERFFETAAEDLATLDAASRTVILMIDRELVR